MTSNHFPDSSPVSTQHLEHCSLAELEERARRAEWGMNQALEQRHWARVAQHRAQGRAVEAEWQRRLTAGIDEPLPKAG
jgi:hypothetical protein